VSTRVEDAHTNARAATADSERNLESLDARAAGVG
jgi:hypothetical protein